MCAFVSRPLGQPIPESPHAVSVSLPTLAAVRGYEEKDPRVTSRMEAGYPRFFVGPLARSLTEEVGKQGRFAGRQLWLTSSAGMAKTLASYVSANGAAAEPFEDTVPGADAIHGVAHAADPAIASQAKLFLQHVGGFISSREAEDQLIARGLRTAPFPETAHPGGAAACRTTIEAELLTALPGARAGDLLLANCGMNAFYAAYRAISEIQAPRGRTGWVQLGWLYLDTIEILRKLSPPGQYHFLGQAQDLQAVERLFEARGPSLAGLVTEIPTNPLIQTPEVEALAALCRRHGVTLVLDPTVASPYSVNVLPQADVLVASLTKYTGHTGDIQAGLAVVNSGRPGAAELRERIAAHLEPVYPRVLARLAAEIGRTRSVLERIEATTPRVAAFLSSHPHVKAVYWALQAGSADNYRRVAWNPSRPGGMISFTLRVPLESFYDRLRLAKGPSFGMATTLICPFLYLAHYDLVTTEAGRARLAANGLDPDLLRLCVGTEPADEIIAALGEALA